MLKRYERYESLYGVRVIAIISVVLFHYFEVIGFDTTPLRYHGETFFRFLFYGSAFFLTKQLIAERAITKKINFSSFYIRRVLRTWVLYYLGLLFCIWYYGAPENDLPHFFIFTQNWTKSEFFIHSWSLALEEQFYLVLPVLVFFIKNRKVALVSVVALLVFGFYLRWNTEIFPSLNRKPLMWLDALWVGILVAYYEKSRIWNFILKHGTLFQVLTLALLVSQSAFKILNASWYPIACSLLTGVLGIAILKKETVLNEFLSRSVFYRLSQLGYCWYLIHPFVFSILEGVYPPEFLVRNEGQFFLIITSLLTTYLISVGVWKLIEEPLLRYRDKHYPLATEKSVTKKAA